MNWKVIKDFLRPDGRKIALCLLFSVVYLSLSYVVLIIRHLGYSATFAAEIWELTKHVVECRASIEENLTRINKEKINETFQFLLQQRRKTFEMVNKLSAPFINVINLLSLGIGEPTFLGLLAGEKIVVFVGEGFGIVKWVAKGILPPLSWYLFSCLIVWIWSRLVATKVKKT